MNYVKLPSNPIEKYAILPEVLASSGVIDLCKFEKKYFYVTMYPFETPKKRDYLFYIAKAPKPQESALHGEQYYVPRTVVDVLELKWFSCQSGEPLTADDIICRGADVVEMFCSYLEKQAVNIMQKRPAMTFPEALLAVKQAEENLQASRGRRGLFPRSFAEQKAEIEKCNQKEGRRLAALGKGGIR